MLHKNPEKRVVEDAGTPTTGVLFGTVFLIACWGALFDAWHGWRLSVQPWMAHLFSLPPAGYGPFLHTVLFIFKSIALLWALQYFLSRFIQTNPTHGQLSNSPLPRPSTDC
jgi:hypothetical protein